MGLGKTPSREWNRDLKTIQDKSERVARRLPELPNSLPTGDLDAMRKLRMKLCDANVNWIKQCDSWDCQFRQFFHQNSGYPDEEISGFEIYEEWLRYAKECNDEGEPPSIQWNEEPFSESTKQDFIITPPEKFFRLDNEIVQLLGEVHALAMEVWKELYAARVDALLADFISSRYLLSAKLDAPRDAASIWIRDGIETLLHATDRTLEDADGGTLGAKQTIVTAEPTSPTQSQGTRKRRERGLTPKDQLILAVLNEHHGYEKGDDPDVCACYDALKLREIQRKLEGRNSSTSVATISAFFERNFKSHADYITACNGKKIDHVLKQLNGDISPSIFLGNKDAQVADDNTDSD